MSNIDPYYVSVQQDLRTYRLHSLRFAPVTVLPLLVAGVGDYWILREVSRLSKRESILGALFMALATLLLLTFLGAWTPPFWGMPAEALLLGAVKWLMMKVGSKATVGIREYFALTLFSSTYCFLQWLFASVMVTRL